MKKRLLSDLGLFSLSVFWVINYIVSKDIMRTIPPMTYTAVRFGIALVAAVLVFPRRVFKVDAYTFKVSIVTGLLVFANIAIHTVALNLTTPAKFGFISGFSVVLVPFLSAVFWKKPIGWASIAGVAAATVGLGFLSFKAGAGFSLEMGDALTLLGTVFGAAYLIVVGETSPKVSDTLAYGILQLLPVAVLSIPLAFLFERPVLPETLPAWGSMLYSAVLATSFVYVANNVLLKNTTATHAGLIYSSEPVLSAFFAYWLIGELLSPRSLTGCALILIGMLVSEFAPLLFPATEKRAMLSQ